MRYYGKALITNAITVEDGRTIPFIHVGGGVGVIATEDPAFIAALDERIEQRRGGVYSLTKETYDEEVKKKTASPLRPLSQERAVISASALRRTPSAPVAAAQEPQPEPVQDDRPQPPAASKPTVGKPKKR